METSGSIPGSAVAPDEVVDLLRRPGPYASVYLCTTSGIDNAAQRSEQRWKPLRADLLAQGAPEEVVATVDALVADAHLHGGGLAVLAPASGAPHVEHLPAAPERDAVRWGPLPLLAPLLDSHQRSVPHVVVLADRLGADLRAVRRGLPDVEAMVDGDEHPIHRVQQGGWSQRRIQERVENTWEKNAGEVADAVLRLVERIDASLILLSGDVRAVQLLRQSLPDDVAPMIREIGGTRTADGSDVDDAEVGTWVATAVAEDTRRLLEKLREEQGQDDRAAVGVEATTTALSEARAAALLVPEVLDGRSLWFGSEPVPVAGERAALVGLGGDDPQEGPAADVLIRAALGTGAAVRIVPPAALPGQVAAILRW